MFTDKRKKAFAVGGSAAALVLIAAVAVLLMGGRNAPPPAEPVVSGSGAADVVVSEVPTPAPTPDSSISVPAVEGEKTEPAPTPDPVLDVEKETHVEVNLSEFEKPETPPEPPKVKDESELKNTEQPPVYEKEQVTVEPKPEAQNGQKKDGMIYIEGFGWIKDEGGGTEEQTFGNPGDELTGNMVGQMG